MVFPCGSITFQDFNKTNFELEFEIVSLRVVFDDSKNLWIDIVNHHKEIPEYPRGCKSNDDCLEVQSYQKMLHSVSINFVD